MQSSDPADDADGPEHFDSDGLAPARPVRDGAIEREERFIETFDEQRLFCQVWRPANGEPAHGAVALMHGYGEHSSRYGHVASALVRAGYGVAAIDARGAGRSTGKRAFVEAYDHYLRDYDRLLERLETRWPDLPVFALGHSHGGLIVLRYALECDPAGDRLSGVVVSSPFLGFQIRVPRHKAAAARVLSRLWPSFSMPNDLDPSHLSHDSNVVAAYEDDPLVLRIATPRWFTEVLDAQRDLRERADRLELPALFLVAGSDELADPSVSEEIFHDLGSADRDMEVYPNLYHEILNEPNWARIVDGIVEWMHRHGGERSEEAA